MRKFAIIGVHAEPYSASTEAFPETNLMWRKGVGRITIRYATMPQAEQLNEVSILLSSLDRSLLKALDESLDAIVQASLNSDELKNSQKGGQNVNFLADQVKHG